MNQAQHKQTYYQMTHNQNPATHAQVFAAKCAISDQIKAYIARTGTPKNVLAARIGTSRVQLNRLLDPTSTSVNLTAIASAASAMGLRLEINFV